MRERLKSDGDVASYNLVKLCVFANCDDFISVQGGGAHLISYFYKRLVVLHKRGPELESGVYDGWYRDTRLGSDKETIRVARHGEELLKFCKIFV